MGDPESRSRRDLLKAVGLGAAAATAAVVAAPSSVFADPGDNVTVDNVNTGNGRTTVKSSGASTSLLGQSTGASVGVFGYTSDGAPGSPPSDMGLFSGVVAIGDDPAAAGLWSMGATGAYGFGSIGVFGDTTASGAGVYGWSGNNMGPGPIAGVGVHAAEGQGGLAGLQVEGRARFKRSGRATVPANAAKVAVDLAGVTASSLVFAVLAKNVPSRHVRAVVAGAGRFTIYLNSTVTTATVVTWIVFDPSLV
jgi:hypothetical protein